MSQKNMSETPPVHYRLFLGDWNVVEAQSESRESQQNQNETKDRGKHRYGSSQLEAVDSIIVRAVFAMGHQFNQASGTSTGGSFRPKTP